VSDAIDDVIRRMYEAPPDGFVAARTAAVAEAREAGDKDAAKRLGALRKPTVAAWVVNLLALRRPELIDELVELATALRSAQRGLKGGELRELTAQRRKIVTALVNAAGKLAVEEDPQMSGAKLPLSEVEATLTAALAEPEIAEQVRTGRLIRAATYAGFGEVPRPRLRLITADDDDADTSPAPAMKDRASDERRSRERAERRRELQRELSAAQAAETKAETDLERAEAAERDAGTLVEELDAELAEVERRRAEAVADVSRQKLARRTAERDVATARRRVGDVHAALEDLAGDDAD
jgi:chromosome segregation ATPase